MFDEVNGKGFLLVSHGNIGMTGHMGFNQCVEIKVDSQVCIGHNHILFLLFLQEIQDTGQCFHAAVVDAHCLFCIRRNQVESAVFSRQVPFAA